MAPALAFAQAPYDLSEIDHILENAVGPFTPGISLALEQNGSVIYDRTFGSFNPNAAVPIASATKWYSAALLMAVVDEGRLALDDRVSRYLPEYSGAKAAITLRQLLSHTSGLPEDAPCIAAREMTLARCASEIAAIPLDAVPGTRFSYGGVSMQVGGRVAEVAGGDAWRRLFARKIAAPLGFSCTDYDVFSAPENPRIAGGATSCTGDYLRFLRMILQRGVYDGRRVLSPEAVNQMLEDQTGGVPIAYSPYQTFAQIDTALAQARYGVGVWRERVDSAGELEVVSSQGAFGYTPFIDFKRNLIGVLAATSVFSQVVPAYIQLERLIRRVIPVAPLRSAAVVNGASFRSAGAVTASEIVSIFGEWPAAPTRVLFDNVPQNPIMSNSRQVNVSTPAGLRSRFNTSVQLEFSSGATPAITLGVIDADPALFTEDGSGTGRAAVWQQGGDVVALFGTGFGPGPVSVEIGGRTVDVLYAGEAPGLAPGVIQINVRIPPGTAPGAMIAVRSGDRFSAQRTYL